MSKVRKITIWLVMVVCVLFLAEAIVAVINGDRAEFRTALLWCIVCVMQCRMELMWELVRDQDRVIGRMIELLGLMTGFVEVADDE